MYMDHIKLLFYSGKIYTLKYTNLKDRIWWFSSSLCQKFLTPIKIQKSFPHPRKLLFAFFLDGLCYPRTLSWLQSYIFAYSYSIPTIGKVSIFKSSSISGYKMLFHMILIFNFLMTYKYLLMVYCSYIYIRYNNSFVIIFLLWLEILIFI